MASCNDCIHYNLCRSISRIQLGWRGNSVHYVENVEEICKDFKGRFRFVELPTARKIKHTPDIDKMREFHKLGLGSGMGERSIFWTCSNCELWVSLAHKFCPNCGAKFEAEQALKEREA